MDSTTMTQDTPTQDTPTQDTPDTPARDELQESLDQDLAAHQQLEEQLRETAEERQQDTAAADEERLAARTERRKTLAQRLREETVGVRLSQSALGTRKKITSEQRERAAHLFDAEADWMNASKKLVDTRHPKFLAVTKILGEARWYWQWQTVDYPHAGIRLLRRDKLDEFDATMQRYKQALSAAVRELQQVYTELLERARERLGELFDEADYPTTLANQWDMTWEVRSVEPPDYLKELNPKLWEQERAKAEARLMEGVLMAEQAFMGELHGLVARMAERLRPGDDGKRKVFRDSAVENLTEFFARFRALNVNSNEDLDALVQQAEDTLQGVTADEVRSNAEMRTRLAEQMTAISSRLDKLMVDAPDRAIELEDEEG